jgi:hypothetical protein
LYINIKNEDKEYSIVMRTNGIGLAYITDKTNVLLMPTQDFTILFSMENIEDFISTVKNNVLDR